MKTFVSAASAAAVMLASPACAATADDDKGSRYLQCDGQPNNMSDGEGFARFVGAVTLLGIFAPAPEAPDPSKRQFGEAGVTACNLLLEGEAAEGNGFRRIPLILARGLHQIEAKNYQAALDDVAKAKAEAAALGLVGNPHFDRSMGLSFGNIEAAARLRMEEPATAQRASLERLAEMDYSFVPTLASQTYTEFLRDLSPEAERKLAAQARIQPQLFGDFAARLEEAGRFADAAAKREAFIRTIEELKPEESASLFYAVAALSHALAGNWDDAQRRATFARDNLAARRTKGVPEDNGARVVELLDFYEIIRLAHDGNMAQARRMFAARSQWLEPSLGMLMETNRRLREGAASEELVGALAKTPEELWQERRDTTMAVELQRDTDNKSLFQLIWPYAKIDDFEARSRDTWRTDKSKMMTKEADEETGMWRIFAFGNRQTAIDSIVLHAALQARAQGKEGFTMLLTMSSEQNAYIGPLTYGWFRFVSRDEAGAEAERFLPADEVIAELSQVIPSPETLRAKRSRERRGNAS
jgi:hypothetical protein